MAILAQAVRASPISILSLAIVFLRANSCTEDCHLAAGSLGKIWKQYRNLLPPSAKSLLAELLLDLRLHILPADYLNAGSIVGDARYDIRGVAELLKFVAARKPSLDEHISAGELPPPPPPPPLPSWDYSSDPVQCVELEMQLAVLHGSVLPTLDHFVLEAVNLDEAQHRSDDVCFAFILECFDVDLDLDVASETICVVEPTLDIVPSESQVIATSQPLPAYDDNAYWEDDWYELTRRFFRDHPELSETQAEEPCEQEWLALHGFSIGECLDQDRLNNDEDRLAYNEDSESGDVYS